MREAQANLAIKKLQKVAELEFDATESIIYLTEIRELALKENDPTVVKICRLAKEYIEANGHFDIGYVADEEIGDMTDLAYLCELLLKIDKQENREEVQEIRDRLKAELY